MTAQEYLKQTSPNDDLGLRAELQKHGLRRMVEKEMEMYHQAKLKSLGIVNAVDQSEQLVSFLRQYQKSCEIMHVNKIDAKNFVEQYKTN